jgi:hypothetical protein
MKKAYLSLFLVPVAAMALSACTPAEKASTLPPGKYEHTSTSTDRNGTTYETRKTTDVAVDRYGNKSATVTTEQSKDPKGLFNKSTSTSTSTYEER